MECLFVDDDEIDPTVVRELGSLIATLGIGSIRCNYSAANGWGNWFCNSVPVSIISRVVRGYADFYFPLLGTNQWVASGVTGTHCWVAFGDPMVSTRWYPKWHLYQQSNTTKKKLLCSHPDVGPIRSRRLRPLRDQVIGCTTFQSLSEVISLPFRLDPHFNQLTKCYENPQPHCSGHRSSVVTDWR